MVDKYDIMYGMYRVKRAIKIRLGIIPNYQIVDLIDTFEDITLYEVLYPDGSYGVEGVPTK